MTHHPDSWLLLRDALNASDPASDSPDIILGGAKPNPDYISAYDKDVSDPIAYGADNHVYVRAKNTSDSLAFGNVSVFVSTLDNLTSPSFWQRILTEDKQTQQAIGAAAGDVSATQSPFVWSDVEKAPWCLIAAVTDSDHPMPDMPHWVQNEKGFDNWISAEPNMAYKLFKAPPKPVPNETYSWSGFIDLKNKAEEDVTFTVTSSNFAPDAQISFILDNKDADSMVISLGNRTLNKTGVYPTTATVSPGFQSKVTVSYLALPGTAGHPVAFTFTASAEVAGSGGISQSVVLAQFDVDVKASTGTLG